MKLALADMAGVVGVRLHPARALRVVPDPAPEPTGPVVRDVRPSSFEDIIGQEVPKMQLLAILDDFEARAEPAYPHILLSGPSGVGKTTFAKAIAGRRGTECHVTAPAALRSVADVIMVLGKVKRGDVVFIDEIHGLRRPVQEALYQWLEGDPVPFSTGTGKNRSVGELKVPPSTLVAGTTNAGRLEEAFRNRFAFRPTLERYSDDEVSRIIRRAAECTGTVVTADGADALALLARGTARMAVNELMVQAKAAAGLIARQQGPDAEGDLPEPVIDGDAVETMRTLFEYDHLGLSKDERRLLRVLCVNMGGGPIGRKKLGDAMGSVSVQTVDALEEWLSSDGMRLMWYDGTGRKATVLAYKHLTETDPGGKVFKPPPLVVGWSRQIGATDDAWLDSL